MYKKERFLTFHCTKKQAKKTPVSTQSIDYVD